MNHSSLESKLQHSRAAYLHAIRALPSMDGLGTSPIHQYGFEFSTDKQVFSQIIELGWAFFPRYEACLENWLKSNNVKLSKKKSTKMA